MCQIPRHSILYNLFYWILWFCPLFTCILCMLVSHIHQYLLQYFVSEGVSVVLCKWMCSVVPLWALSPPVISLLILFDIKKLKAVPSDSTTINPLPCPSDPAKHTHTHTHKIILQSHTLVTRFVSVLAALAVYEYLQINNILASWFRVWVHKISYTLHECKNACMLKYAAIQKFERNLEKIN